MSKSRWFHDDAVAARDAAAEAVRTAVTRDRRRATVRLARFLDHLETHLFDATYRVGDGIRVAGLHDSNLSGQFRRRFGKPPTIYVQGHRLRVARALLVGTDMPVGQVAEVCGFSSRRTMTRLFREHFGETPTLLRTRATAPTSPALFDEATAAMSRALRRKASLAERLELAQRLLVSLGIDEERDQGHEATQITLSAKAMAELACDVGWRWLDRLPQKGQLAMVRGQAHHVPGLLDFLFEKTRSEGRGHRTRGVEVAELALASLDTGHLEVRVDTERLHADRARALAWLGNAQRLALDLPAAEKSLAAAAKLAERTSVPLAAKAEVWDLSSLLRWYQTRFEEGRRLAGKAIRAYQVLGQWQALAEVFLTRAYILVDSGLPFDALTDIEMCLDLLDSRVVDRRLDIASLQILAQAHIDLDRTKDVANLVMRAEKIATEAGIAGTAGYHAWLLGQAAFRAGAFDQAESRLREACSYFEQDGEIYHLGCVTVELALTQIKRGQLTKATSALRSVLPVFEALEANRDGLAAYRLLVEATLSRSSEPIERLLSLLKVLRRQPAVLASLCQVVSGIDFHLKS